MTKDEFSAALSALKLTRTKAAKMLGVSRPHTWKWATGAAPIPKSVGLVLKGAVEMKAFRKWLESQGE